MKRLVLLFLVSILIVSCDKPQVTISADSKTAEKEIVRDGVFLHITESYNDPHKVLMPLKMANMMAKDKDVLVYLDIHAVELVKKDAKDLEYQGFDSFRKLIASLIEKKVGIYACPTCLQIAGISPDQLIEGVQLAQKDKFFEFTKGRIITLDY